MRSVPTPFEVVPGTAPDWPGITAAGRVVARFLAGVRVTGDEDAAEEVLAPVVLCHQVVSTDPVTVRRTPRDYARHVQDMLAAFGPFRFVVTEVLADGDRVYVRWSQHGHQVLAPDGSPGTGRPITDVGSAVYRVEDDRIAEYWVQLDRLGLAEQHQDLVR